MSHNQIHFVIHVCLGSQVCRTSDQEQVLNVMRKHNVMTQVFEDSNGIWIVVGYC